MTEDAGKIKKRSITISGHRTSITCEDIFWKTLKEIATTKGISRQTLIEKIDKERTTSLSSALRVYALREKLEN
ncbi:MAG: ribbon-helix-helix domain-containing protein [Alphaproteobacteria bacterium]